MARTRPAFVNHFRSEQSRTYWRQQRRLAVGVLASAFLALSVLGLVSAADPPQPDFAWPYGKVQLDGENLTPPVQRVIALVNGKTCGEAMTLTAQAGNGVPVGDVGKTVYVVDVLADGTSAGQRSGCGRPGDVISLYFPDSHRMAAQQTTFQAGSQRLDLDLGPELSFRLQGPMLANDGLN